MSLLSTIIFISFAIPMSYNMILFIRSTSMKLFTIEEEDRLKKVNKKRIRTVIILFILLPLVMGLLFFCNYLLKK